MDIFDRKTDIIRFTERDKLVSNYQRNYPRQTDKKERDSSRFVRTKNKRILLVCKQHTPFDEIAWQTSILFLLFLSLSLSLLPLSLPPPPISMNDCFRCNKGLHPGIEWQILTKGIFSRSFHRSLCTRRVTSSARHRPIDSTLGLASGLFITIPTDEREREREKKL